MVGTVDGEFIEKGAVMTEPTNLPPPPTLRWYSVVLRFAFFIDGHPHTRTLDMDLVVHDDIEARLLALHMAHLTMFDPKRDGYYLGDVRMFLWNISAEPHVQEFSDALDVERMLDSHGVVNTKPKIIIEKDNVRPLFPDIRKSTPPALDEGNPETPPGDPAKPDDNPEAGKT